MGRSIDRNNRILGLFGSDEESHGRDHSSHSPSPINSPNLPAPSFALAVAQIRMATSEWVSRIGPIESWPRRFQQELDKINAATEVSSNERQDKLDKFLGEVEDVVEEGRGLLQSLRQAPHHPLSNGSADFVAIGDLMDTLYRGVSLLDARLDILSPQAPWAADGDSGLRRYSNFLYNVR